MKFPSLFTLSMCAGLLAIRDMIICSHMEGHEYNILASHPMKIVTWPGLGIWGTKDTLGYGDTGLKHIYLEICLFWPKVQCCTLQKWISGLLRRLRPAWGRASVAPSWPPFSDPDYVIHDKGSVSICPKNWWGKDWELTFREFSLSFLNVFSFFF